MKNVNLKIEKVTKITADINLSWEDWELYEKADSAKVARKLNTRLETLISRFQKQEMRSAQIIWSEMADELESYSDHGAYDTEPRSICKKIIAEVYNINVNELY